MIDLGVFSHDTVREGGQANDINNRGQIVGSSTAADNNTHAFLWRRGVMIDLGSLGGGYAEADTINDRGQVAGLSTTASGDTHAFLWDNGVMSDLGPAQYVHDVNNRGQVVGSAWFGDQAHAAMWFRHRVIDLGTLNSGYWSDAAGINRRGDIVGSGTPQAQFPSADIRPLLWRNGAVTGLGTLGGAQASGRAINDRGVVVGMSAVAGGGNHAFAWRHGTLIDLTGRGVVGEDVVAGINNSGDMVALRPVGFGWQAILYVPR